MSKPEINPKQWIKIGSNNIDGYVLKVNSDKSLLTVGYYQNETKTISEDVIWSGEFWIFKEPSHGLYLKGTDADIIRKGPPIK